MPTLFSSLTEHLRASWKPLRQLTTPRAYRCQCGRPVFFRNTRCLACGTPLGYEPQRGQVLPLAPGPRPGQWRLFHDTAGQQLFHRCGNFDSPAGCNWLVPLDEQDHAPPLCTACRLNRTIPDLSVAENLPLWSKLEAEKRRLVSQLIALGLPVAPKSQDPARGLAFDFLRPLPGRPVMTGHSDGVITISIDEADDAKRERLRAQMSEPYRTLLGHFRHEVGHYYWDRLVRDTPWLDEVRRLFGDDRADYGAALQRHYEQGPPADWPRRFVTAYAAAHPWEDWAESWAHYLHMVDTVDTALSFGIDADRVQLEVEPWGPGALWRPDDPGAADFLGFINAWVELTAVLNELSRSMGQPDFYPFVLPRPAVGKLQLIHLVIQDFGRSAGLLAAPFTGASTAA